MATEENPSKKDDLMSSVPGIVEQQDGQTTPEQTTSRLDQTQIVDTQAKIRDEIASGRLKKTARELAKESVTNEQLISILTPLCSTNGVKDDVEWQKKIAELYTKLESETGCPRLEAPRGTHLRTIMGCDDQINGYITIMLRRFSSCLEQNLQKKTEMEQEIAKLNAITSGEETNEELPPKEAFERSLALQPEYQQLITVNIPAAENGLKELSFFADGVCKGLSKDHQTATVICGWIKGKEPKEIEELAKELWNEVFPSEEIIDPREQTSRILRIATHQPHNNADRKDSRRIARENPDIIRPLKMYAASVGAQSHDDFDLPVLREEFSIPEGSPEDLLLSKVLIRLKKAEQKPEESGLVIPLVKLAGALLTAYTNPSMRKQLCGVLGQTPTPVLLEIAVEITDERTANDTVFDLRVATLNQKLQEQGAYDDDGENPEQQAHIPHTIRLRVDEARETRKNVRESTELDENTQKSLDLILFYALHLLKRAVARIPKDDSDSTYRLAIGRANRATLPLRKIAETAEELLGKAKQKKGVKQLIVIPDSITTHLSTLRAIAEDISFSSISTDNNSSTTNGAEIRDFEKTIDNIRHLGIVHPYDIELLKTLQTLFVRAKELFPNHVPPRNISAEELVGYMLESDTDRKKPIYHKWTVQILVRAAGNLIPISTCIPDEDSKMSIHTDEKTSTGEGSEKITLAKFTEQTMDKHLLEAKLGPNARSQATRQLTREDFQKLARLRERWEELKEMAVREENNDRFSIDRASNMTLGIMAFLLLVPPKERANSAFETYFDDLLQVQEIYARRGDTLFDESMVVDFINKMSLETGTSNEDAEDEKVDAEWEELFGDDLI